MDISTIITKLNMFKPFSIVLFLMLPFQIAMRTKEEWKSRTIYQLLTDRFYSPDS